MSGGHLRVKVISAKVDGGGPRPSNYNGPSPVTINFGGDISVIGTGTVTYVWDRSDGATMDPITLTFEDNAPNWQHVTDTWELSGNAGDTISGWEAIHVLTPNEEYSEHAEFSIIFTDSR